MNRPRLLLVDDEEVFTMPLAAYLMRVGFDTVIADSLTQARAAIRTERLNGILLDLHLPDGNGIDFIEEIRAELSDVAIVVVTGTDELSIAVEAMRRGADHFATKPVNLPDLELFLRKGLEVGMLRRRTSVTQRLSKPTDVFVGRSVVASNVFEMARVAADCDSAVLITGETGTGKGVVARWIHQQSSRRTMPFVEVNCSTLRGDLLSSELFGHARGAFTSAVDARPGLLDAADGGTLFLDEIGDMDLAVQAQFLKAVEEKRYRRMGEVQTRHSDFRLLSATNRDLAADVQSGRFRQDLLYRIDVLPLRMPSIREAPEDFEGLARHLLRTLGAGGTPIDAPALARLAAYDWPGNVRELRNVLERALLLARGGTIRIAHLRGLEEMPSTQRAAAVGDAETLRSVLRHAGGDKHRAARELGISRATLYRRLKTLDRK